MSSVRQKLFIWPVQVVFWLVITGLFLIFNLQALSLRESTALAFLSSGFIVLVIYGNASWLIPIWFSKGQYFTYALMVFTFLIAASLVRTYTYRVVRAALDWPPEAFGHAFLLAMITAVLSAIVSVFFRLSYDYVIMREEQANLKAENIEAKLHLLYQQVQPHFLFNTLNNIYGVIRVSSPEGAALIEQLSSVVRYFLHENQSCGVFLKDEIELVRAYIHLEAIRLRYDMPVTIKLEGNTENVVVPRFLLLPLVENIFKHGIDKRSQQNFATITITVGSASVTFEAINCLITVRTGDQKPGTGLTNLKKRLLLYYGGNASLNVRTNKEEFAIAIAVPIENGSVSPIKS